MSNASPQPYGATLVWLLVAFLLSMVVALSAAILKTRDGAKVTAIITSAGVAFGSSLALCITTLTAARIL